MDIAIYTNPVILIHKQECDSCFWEMSRLPKKFEEGKRIYFATKGRVRGYFICDEICNQALYWDGDSWHSIRKKIECKPFRGFRYKWW